MSACSPTMSCRLHAMNMHLADSRTPEKQNIVRYGTLNDIPDLVELELQCFDCDIINRRQFRHMLTKANADLLVIEDNRRTVAYVLVLYSRNSKIARLYSIAVAAHVRKNSLGQRLVEAAENAARRRYCTRIRLEIRKDNFNSIKLFQRMGYQQFGVHSEYYEDHMDAVRMEKRLPLITEIDREIITETTTHLTTGQSHWYSTG